MVSLHHERPAGSGTACSSAQPCSITQAQAKVRTIVPAMTGDVVVQLAGGTYALSSPANGEQPQLWDCSGSTNQEWSLFP
ncbi:hypothetical protein G7043_36285 [Lentzea sp. NEAU-D13]|uniref:Ricin-type beta-trefoil lectin domain-like n=1 Tax=Lentzea alba TaxID=2714351 RepID=A0A7C9RVJ2_9PSEU|nr:hypothetical protein [Lentzea alba]NGY64385.1 hypothetical protein [Lentzea alba]